MTRPGVDRFTGLALPGCHTSADATAKDAYGPIVSDLLTSLMTSRQADPLMAWVQASFQGCSMP